MKTLYININGEVIKTDSNIEVIGSTEDSMIDSFYISLGMAIADGMTGIKYKPLVSDFANEKPNEFQSFLDRWQEIKAKLLGDNPSGDYEFTLSSEYLEWLRMNATYSTIYYKKYQNQHQAIVKLSLDELYEDTIGVIRRKVIRFLQENNDVEFDKFVLNEKSVTSNCTIVRVLQKAIGDIPFMSYEEWINKNTYRIPKEWIACKEDEVLYGFIEYLINKNLLQLKVEANVEKPILYIPANSDIISLGTNEEIQKNVESIKSLIKGNYMKLEREREFFNLSLLVKGNKRSLDKTFIPTEKWLKYIREYCLQIDNNQNIWISLPEDVNLQDGFLYIDLSTFLLKKFLHDYGMTLGDQVSQNLISLKSPEGLYGLAYNNNRGLVCIPSYKSIAKMYEGKIAVQSTDGLYGFVDERGNVIKPCVYSRVHRFINNRARVWLDGKEFFITDKDDRIQESIESFKR